METVKRFEPDGGLGEKIPNSGNVVGQNRAEGSGQKNPESGRGELWRRQKEEKNSAPQNLVGEHHGKEALEFCNVIRRRVDPVADASVTMGNGVDGQMAGHSGNEGRQGTARDP